MTRRSTKQDRPVRALNIFGEDRLILEAIGHGVYLLNGFRNQDIRASLNNVRSQSAELSSSQVSYRLRALRSHGVIRREAVTRITTM